MYKKYKVAKTYYTIRCGTEDEWYIIELRDNEDDPDEITGLDRFYVLKEGYMINHDHRDPEDGVEMFYWKFIDDKWRYQDKGLYGNNEMYKEEIRDIMKVRKTDLYKAVYGG